MSVRSERHYRFDVGRGPLWAALTRVDQYRAWWPWLSRFDGTAFAAGEHWRCAVKPPLPYTLEFEITLLDIVEREVVDARLDGDISGTARLSVVDRGGGCELQLSSQLSATSGLARLTDRCAPWLAAIGHDWVLDSGIRQFRASALA